MVIDLVGVVYGSVGECCMVLLVVVLVGDEIVEKLKVKFILVIKDIMVSYSEDFNVYYGFVVIVVYKECVEGYIDFCIEEGVEFVYDGRIS